KRNHRGSQKEGPPEGGPYDIRCGGRPSGGPPLELHAPRTRAELLDLDAANVRQRQQQVRGWLLLGLDVPIAFEPSVRAADDHRRRVAAIVRVAVAHAAA